jgi:diguanylate cyclase (GGDEF)-like protein
MPTNRSEDEFLFDELSNINNMLVNAQRDLQKKTYELEELNKKLEKEISQRKLIEEKLRKLSTQDPLTKIYNLRHFRELSETEIKRTRRFKKTAAFIMLDIDHFKKVNDSHGHAAGDKVLIEVVNNCLNNIREVDVLARYGGEEFIIMLPETDKWQAGATAERLRETIANLEIRVDSGTIQVSSSFGISELNGGDEEQTLETCLKQADKALYQSKEAGRNRVTIWDGEDQI